MKDVQTEDNTFFQTTKTNHSTSMLSSLNWLKIIGQCSILTTDSLIQFSQQSGDNFPYSKLSIPKNIYVKIVLHGHISSGKETI